VTNFLLLARGEDLRSARVLAVSADQQLVGRFLDELMGEDGSDERDEAAGPGPLRVLNGGEHG
jgi:hypothetical protein